MKGLCLPVDQIDALGIEAVNSLLDMDLNKFGESVLSEDINMLIKKIPRIEATNIKHFLDRGIYFVKEGISELIVYLSIEEFVKFLKNHAIDSCYNHKSIDNLDNISIPEDKKYILIKTDFVIDNMTKTRLANGPLKNVLTIRDMHEGLVRGLALGWKYVKELEKGKTVKDLEQETGVNHRRLYKYINLAYLSPKIICDIFENINPSNKNLNDLLDLASKYINFNEQELEWRYGRIKG